MAKVWVQVWSAQVPGAVEVEESELRQVQGLETVKAMVPMLLAVKDSDLVPPMDLVQLEESVEVLPPLSEYQRTAMAKGWGWVLGLEGHRYKQD
jgi:hypothetical protein